MPAFVMSRPLLSATPTRALAMLERMRLMLPVMVWYSVAISVTILTALRRAAGVEKLMRRMASRIMPDMYEARPEMSSGNSRWLVWWRAEEPAMRLTLELLTLTTDSRRRKKG